MREHRYHMTRISANAKLGGIPASTTSDSTCPDNCSLKNNGCYADSGPLQIHWKAVSEGLRGGTLDEFCKEVKALPKFQLWRWAQAGDLPGDGTYIDQRDLHKIVMANKGRHGFGYTHYDPLVSNNATAVSFANKEGFTLNMSAETLTQADNFADLDIGPVVVILPADQTENTKTLQGRQVIVCPASLGKTTCALCAICANPTRKSIVGFPAHGSGKKKAEKVFYAALEATPTT